MILQHLHKFIQTLQMYATFIHTNSPNELRSFFEKLHNSKYHYLFTQTVNNDMVYYQQINGDVSNIQIKQWLQNSVKASQ